VHARSIELGLERVDAVLARMQLRTPAYGVITVTGTNGKGSTVAMLESCLRAAGYRVGSYTSPHLIRYNERIRLPERLACDEELTEAFARIEVARGDIPLTYFEFGTLAAFDLFARAALDIAVLEVGMGGRLDAVNAVDPDCAIVTGVDIDHTQWLGETREAIGYEKAGIYRADRPALCGDAAPPASLVEHARAIGATLFIRGRDYGGERSAGGWHWHGLGRARSGLPQPSLRGDYQLDNAATVVMALETLAARFPVTQAQLRQGLLAALVPGRFQVLPGRPVRVLDVAHNAQAARALAATLQQQATPGCTVAVLGMLRDKDLAAVTAALNPLVDRWYLATLHTARGASAQELAAVLAGQGATHIQTFESPLDAWRAALAGVTEADRVVAFGSFHTVGDILAAL
jgi:dihydrofolate synthase/folylpolyglutamate synthase